MKVPTIFIIFFFFFCRFIDNSYFCTMFKNLFVLFVACSCLLCACGSGEGDQKDKQRLQTTDDASTLSVATTPTLDCLPIFVAQETGLFENNHLKVRLLTEQAQMDCQEALLKERAQVVASDVMRVEKMRRGGKALNYVSATNLKWQLISNRLARITEAKQMGDKMMAMARYSGTDFFSRHVVDSVKPKNKVFYIQINDVDIRLKMLINNEMDAVWLPEPQATEARLAKHPVIFDGQKQDWQFGCLATLTKWMNDANRKKQIETFTKVYDMACDSINKHGLASYGNMIQKYCHVSERTLKSLPKTFFPHAAQPREKDVVKAQNMNWND